MEEKRLEWVANDDWDTKHSVSETFAIATLKALYDEWPGGLEEIEACFKARAQGAADRDRLSTQVIQDLASLYRKTINNKIWVLTEEYNDYDQYGEYFVHAWIGKPTKEQLALYLHPASDLDYVFVGGGRRKVEDHWYNFKEVQND